jgi:hypothetical protein
MNVKQFNNLYDQFRYGTEDQFSNYNEMQYGGIIGMANGGMPPISFTPIVGLPSLNYNAMGYAGGGYVNTGLTKTVPPVSGPNPQGVESLFKNRYM